MSEDNTNEDMLAALAPLRVDFTAREILEAVRAGRAEREISLFKAHGIGG